jgi:hypothetical protein
MTPGPSVIECSYWIGIQRLASPVFFVMSEFQAIADELHARIDAIVADDWTRDGRRHDLQMVVILAARGEELCRQIADIIGTQRMDTFYKGYMPDGASGAFHTFGRFVHLLPACCTPLGDGKVAFDKNQFVEHLDQYAAMIRAGRVDYQFVLHIANVTISADFELAKGVSFRRIAPEAVWETYPLNHGFPHQPQLLHMYLESWPKHCVEVVVDCQGVAAEVQNHFRLEKQHALVNSIEHSFVLSGVAENNRPCITHVSQFSVLESHTMYRGFDNFSFEPYLLTDSDIASLRETYVYLEESKSDPVLSTAIDRFILGKRQEMHNPNMVNEPHWDKVVDYVIAMESLFTTGGHGEPTYRFSINGASLLSQATSENVHTIYKGLKNLYDIRSAVVHGGGADKVSKVANRFVRDLGIDKKDHQHSLGRLGLVCTKVEEWLRKVLYHLCKMQAAERPFNKPGGWEELLWGKPPLPTE